MCPTLQKYVTTEQEKSRHLLLKPSGLELPVKSREVNNLGCGESTDRLIHPSCKPISVPACSPLLYLHRNIINDPSQRIHGTYCWTLVTWLQMTCQTMMRKVSKKKLHDVSLLFLPSLWDTDDMFCPSSGAWPVLIDDFVEFARPIVTGSKRKTL